MSSEEGHRDGIRAPTDPGDPGDGESSHDLRKMERDAVAALDVDGLVSATRELVRIPSWGGKETPAQEWMAERMAASGLDVDLWEIDLVSLSRHPSYRAELERDRALGVVGTREGQGEGRSLVLNGHVDVVPPGDESLWSHDPFGGTVEGDRIYGRGALDMKGPLLAALYALRALRDAEIGLAGTVHLESVVGEEDGGLGTLAALERGYRADGAVVMEPTEEAIAPSQAGALNFRVRVPGLAAHGAVRSEGVSAIENFIPLYRALEGLEAARNEALGGDPLFASYPVPFPICVGTIRGGDWASSVPDHLTFEGRFGVAPGESVTEACRSLEDAVAAAAEKDPWLRRHSPSVEWWGGRFDPARTSPDHPLVRSMIAAAQSVADEDPEAPDPRLAGMTYGADMGLLVNDGGIPTVLYGPGDIRRAHRPDEHVAVDALARAARTLAVAMIRFCGVASKGDFHEERA